MVNAMNAEIQALYRAILRDLRRDGESSRVLCGRRYDFLYSDYGTEVVCDGKFLCEISHDWELEELLMDLSGE